MSIGSRLREERERIGLTQAALGSVGGVLKQAQLKYESDSSSPSAKYLSEVAKVGVDIQYVVTGTRLQELIEGKSISEEERLLIYAFRNASKDVRAYMLTGIPSISLMANNQTVIGNNNIVSSSKKK